MSYFKNHRKTQDAIAICRRDIGTWTKVMDQTAFNSIEYRRAFSRVERLKGQLAYLELQLKGTSK